MSKARIFTVGDTGNPFVVNVINSTGNPYNLSGCTASFFMGSVNCVGSANIVTGMACSIPTGSDGKIEYYWTASNLLNTGNFKAKIKIKKADTRILWAPFGVQAEKGFEIIIVDNYE